MPFKTIFIIYLAAAFFGTANVTAYAFDATGLAHCMAVQVTGTEQLDTARQKFYDKFAAQNTEFDPDEVSIKTIPRDPLTEGVQSTAVVLRYEGYRLAVADVNLFHGNLSFDVDVEPDKSRLGAYSYLLTYTVHENPSVNKITARMPFNDSENTRSFFRSCFGEGKSFIEPALELPEQLRTNSQEHRFASNIELRNKILTSLKANAAMKARVTAGFTHISEIIVDPRRWDVSFVVERGAQVDSQTKVIIRDPKLSQGNPGSVIQLNADGTLAQLNSQALTLKDYDEVRPRFDHDQEVRLDPKKLAP